MCWGANMSSPRLRTWEAARSRHTRCALLESRVVAIILIALPVQFSPSVQDFCTTQISVVWESVQFIKRKQNKVGEPSTLMDTVIRESSNSNHKLLLFFLLLFFYQIKTTACLTNTKLMHFKNAERFAKISFFHSYIKECLPRWKILLQLGHR